MVEASDDRHLQNYGWIGVDLDGTLAEYHGWTGWNQFGRPIPAMVERLKRWLAEGREVRIMTARMTTDDNNRYYCAVQREWFTTHMMRLAIAGYCAEHIGKSLDATCVKDMRMDELWDDRAVQVVPNTGRSLAEEHAAELSALRGAP